MANILLGVTGSIAAYKAADLASKLTQAGHAVTALMTRAATQLVSPNTFLNLTGNRCYTDLWDPAGQTEHIALTDQAELFVLAPATANALAKLAHGLADDMVHTTLLAVRCPVLVCPAMNTRMWENPAVQANLAKVQALGERYQILPPAAGSLACGHTGAGRLQEPDVILAEAQRILGTDLAPREDPKAFFEILTLEETPNGDALRAERDYRDQALAAGELLAGGQLGSAGSHRYGYLHRVSNLDEALRRARAAPLAQRKCQIEVFPWQLEQGIPALG